MNRATKIHQALIAYYGEPIWRNPLPAIDELVSTILSQNTNDNNRDRAFDSLRDRYPTWELVRDADSDQVIDAIRVAGLANQKGPRIQIFWVRILHKMPIIGCYNLKVLAQKQLPL